MTKYLEPSFSVLPPPGTNYRDNHDRIFGKKDETVEVTESAGDCVSPSPLLTYIELLIADADNVAERAFGDGPGRMVDSVRWSEAVCVSSALNDVRTCLLTGARADLHLWRVPVGASRD